MPKPRYAHTLPFLCILSLLLEDLNFVFLLDFFINFAQSYVIYLVGSDKCMCLTKNTFKYCSSSLCLKSDIYHVQEPFVLYKDKALLPSRHPTEFVQTVPKGDCYMAQLLF